jgi:lysophospholipase L1-like esterase
MQKIFGSLLFFINSCMILTAQNNKTAALNFFAADNPFIQYTGRISFSNPLLPKFWQPGVYIETKFVGGDCDIIVRDQELWGKNHNYLEVVVDGEAVRLQTKSKQDTIEVARGLSKGNHTLVICKNTEANIGYVEFVGIRCKQLVKPPAKPLRKIEFIGNSITCGTGSDQSEVPCGKGVWQDQHNAYLAYGPTVARSLNAQWVLSAVSGIGLMHSCCNLDIVMPPVFDKIDLRGDSILWDFKNYQPDVLTVCLGQNDGIQDSVLFCNNYVKFLTRLRIYYPSTQIILLSSPMGDEKLTAALKNYLSAIKKTVNNNGDKKVETYFFVRRYINGCDSHPDLAEHKVIAAELNVCIKKIMRW